MNKFQNNRRIPMKNNLTLIEKEKVKYAEFLDCFLCGMPFFTDGKTKFCFMCEEERKNSRNKKNIH